MCASFENPLKVNLLVKTDLKSKLSVERLNILNIQNRKDYFCPLAFACKTLLKYWQAWTGKKLPKPKKKKAIAS
jgi:hypothetical protein